MKRFIVIALALALTGGVAYANYCARDYVPAATLLVPFGIVDLDDNYAPNYAGYTTLLTVTNVSSERILIHISVWDVLSYPVVDWDEVLSGYDVWSINFRDLLEGHFERFDTAVERTGGVITKSPDYAGFWGPQDWTQPSPVYDYGTILGPRPEPWGPTTNNGRYTQKLNAPQDIDFGAAAVPGNPFPYSFENCYFPYGYLPSVGAAVLDTLVGEAAWSASLTHRICRGTSATAPLPDWIKNFDDTQAWFYVTVDVVNFCSRNFPSDSEYWYEQMTPWDVNVIIGDIIYLDTANNFSESVPCAHIETDWDTYYRINIDTNPWYGYTFYGDFQPIDTDPTSGTNWVWFDTREPLGTAFAFRYLNTGGVSSAVRVWKSWSELSSTLLSTGSVRYYFTACASYIYYAWDENENTKARGGGPSGFTTNEPNTLPWEVQEVPLTTGNFTALMPGNGWMLLVFDPSLPSIYSVRFYFSSVGAEISFDQYIQAWVGVKYMFAGFSTMLEAAQMANVWCFDDQTLARMPILGIDYDYEGNWFE